MQQDPSLPPHYPEYSEMPSSTHHNIHDDPTSSSVFEWSDFLDFNLDENLNISFPEHEPAEQPGFDQSQPQENLGRVRKRDPRLICSNFLAGRIPCACPELDEKLEEERQQEELGGMVPGKKRTRTVRLSGGVTARCQVPECEVDISELKGYHKRHRVCLQCANASAVVLDGESKRYCQQCGKFHILSDFDEGKRSCRRKLERHNNRRRRKPNDSKGNVDKESQPVFLVDDVSGDDDTGKDSTCVNTQMEERETLLESDAHVSTPGSALGSQHLQDGSVVSFGASGETHVDGEKQNPKSKHSPSYYDNKSSFYSVCPAGRISFKLYDWNPAEFPRRLRHQIFQWLASMPVELEGYIRPGCTILTAFIAMPKSAWLKLLEEPALCIEDLVASPGSMLSGKGRMLVYLNDMIFRLTKDATSVVKVGVKDRAPKLHYIYPTCFEAGRPMEFVACGSNLLQQKFRFLISFAGRYLEYNICVSSLCCKKGDNNSFDHQLVKIYVPQTDLNLFGPAFVEVENQSGLSNFIPILLGNKETCVEMEILELKLNPLFSSKEQELSPLRPACEIFALRQAQFSDFVLEVAWCLKKPLSGQKLMISHIERFNYLLNFLIENESSVILERVLYYIKGVVHDNSVTCISDAEMRLLWKYMDAAESMIHHKSWEKDFVVLPTTDEDTSNHTTQNDNCSVLATNRDLGNTFENRTGVREFLPSMGDGATVPLLNREVVMNVNIRERPTKSNGQLLTMSFWTSRPLIMAIATFGVCFGICAVILHPQRVSEIAMTIQRSLFDHS